MNRDNLLTQSKDFCGRLVALSTGAAGLRSPVTAEAAFEGDEPVVIFTASDATLDRYNEIITPEGWQLANYQRNPVFQCDHAYGIDDTIGRCEKVWLEGGKLKMQIRFAVGVNPKADMALKLYRGKFLNAVSVGFIPRRWENGSEASGYRRKYLECELIELSAVAVPANPNALQDALESGVITPEQIRDALSQQAVPPANAPVSGGGDTTAGLLESLQTTLAQMRGK